MGIPKTITKKYGQKLTYIATLPNDLFLYENEKTKVKETFSKYDLKLINNKVIDSFLKGERERRGTIITVYDRETGNEFECVSQHEVASFIGKSYSTVHLAIKNKEWIGKRYFAEYKEGKINE